MNLNLFIAVMFMMVVLQGRIEAASLPVLELYSAFLSNGGCDVFVSIERETLLPKREGGIREVRLPNGGMATINLWTKDYLAICKHGSNFICAYSSKKPIQALEQIGESEELLGFDGEYYWSLALNKPVTLRFGNTNGVSDMPATVSFNPLTIIPRSEASRPAGQFQTNIKLATILGLAAEGLSVLQFGLKSARPESPGISKNPDRVTIGPDILQVDGDIMKPIALRHRELDSKSEVTVRLDYAEDIITVLRASQAKPYFEARYRLLQVKPIAPLQAAFFSWRTHKEQAGNTINMLVTNGMTVEAIFTNNAVETGAVMDRPVNAQSGVKSKSVIWVLFGMATLAAVLLARRGKTSEMQQNKETKHGKYEN